MIAVPMAFGEAVAAAMGGRPWAVARADHAFALICFVAQIRRWSAVPLAATVWS